MIQVTNLYKSFKRYKKSSDRLKEILLRKSYHQTHNVLKNINIRIAKGETLGILGKNGAGKSTLLKILTGVLLPDSGSFSVQGKVTGLLELGTGFDAELTGIQNIKSNGLLIGMSLAEIAQRQQDIIAFSELGDFINEPVRTYSSGMTMRLAFSIAMHAAPECFVIDEALSVGDAHFQQKCMKHIKQFRHQGGSIIFVSHDLNAVKMLCDKVVVLDEGECAFTGSAEAAVNYYNKIISLLNEQDKYTLSQDMENQHAAKQNYGNHKAKIIKAQLSGEQSNSNIISSGETSYISIDISAYADIDDLGVGIMIRDRFGQDIYGINSHLMGNRIKLKNTQNYQTTFKIAMNISPGKYTITIALHSQDNHLTDCYHWIDNMIKFQVAGIIGDSFAGICRLPTQIEFKQVTNNA